MERFFTLSKFIFDDKFQNLIEGFLVDSHATQLTTTGQNEEIFAMF